MIAPRPGERRNLAPAPQRPNRPPWSIAAATVLILIGIVGIWAICFPAQFRQQLDVSVFRQPTPYTQLFFSKPTALPQALELNQANRFSFTVINNQGRPATYRYTVTISDTKQQQVSGAGSFTIGDSQRITRTVAVVPTARQTRYLVKVALSGTTDFIQFYGNTH